MSTRFILAALFALCQAAALGRLLIAAGLLRPDDLVILRLVTVFQTYSLYLMLGVPEILYLSLPKWQRERGDAHAAQLSGFAMASALTAAVVGGIGSGAMLAFAYGTPASVALAAAVFTAGAALQIGFISPLYLAHGDLIARAAREVVVAALGLTGVWLLARQLGLPGAILGLALGYWLAVAVSWRAWRGIRPLLSRPLIREIVPPGIGQVSIQVGLMLLASLDLVLVTRWRHGDPELPFYVVAVALLTAVSGAAQAIAGPTIVSLIRDDDGEASDAEAVNRAVLAEAAQVSFLLALAVAAATIGLSLLLPQYAGMHRWLPAVAVTCLASRIAYFPTLHLIVTERRRLVVQSASAGIAVLLALLYGLGQVWNAPTPVVLWSSAFATTGYAAVLAAVVLGRRLSTPTIAALVTFLVLMLADGIGTFRGWLDMRASVANVVVVCLVASVVFLRLRGALPWDSFSFRHESAFDHAARSSSK